MTGESGRVQPADEAAARLRAWLCRPESRYWTEDGEHTVGDDVATILAAWDELIAPAST